MLKAASSSLLSSISPVVCGSFVVKRILDRSPEIIGSRWCILTELSAALTLEQHEIWVWCVLMRYEHLEPSNRF